MVTEHTHHWLLDRTGYGACACGEERQFENAPTAAKAIHLSYGRALATTVRRNRERAKLSEEDVAEALRLNNEVGLSWAELARRLGVHQTSLTRRVRKAAEAKA